MRSIHFIFWFLAPFSVISAQIGLKYRVSLTQQQSLRVEVEWQSEAKTETILTYGLGKDSRSSFQHLAAESARTMVLVEEAGVIRVLHDKGTKVVCSYEIINQADVHTSLPIIQPEYFHLLGYNLFAFPSTYQQQTVEISWHGFPSNWLIFNSFGQDMAVQKILVATGDWRESVWAGGKAKMYETKTKNTGFRSYFIGDDVQQHATKLDSLVLNCLLEERRYWEETEPFKGLITIFLPLQSGNHLDLELTGIGVKNAFSVFLAPQKQIPIERLRHLLYHETMHFWIGQQVNMMPTKTMPDERWFMEGFTEYFSYQVEIQNKHLLESDFCGIANQKFFQPLYANEHLASLHERKKEPFYHLGGSNFRPYQIGFAYAWYLDSKLRCNKIKPTTLREVMIELMERSHGHDGTRTDEMFLNLLVTLLGSEIVQIHQAVTEKGTLIPFSQFSDCHPSWQMRNGPDGMPEVSMKN